MSREFRSHARRQRIAKVSRKADKIPGGYIVRDANGQALAYVYARAHHGRSDANQVIDPGRSETDCCEYRPVTGLAEGRANATGLRKARQERRAKTV